MTDDQDDDKPLTAERARQLILSRRAHFLAAALAGIQVSCDIGPSVCLDVNVPPQDAGPDGGPRVCLSPLQPDAGRHFDGGPRVCLSPPRIPCEEEPSRYEPYCPRPDAGTDAGQDAGPLLPDELDGGPRVCLILTLTEDEEDEGQPA